MGFVSSSFTCWKVADWAGPHVHVVDLLSSSQSGCVISARLGVNFPSWFAIPMNHRSSVTEVGGLIFRIAAAFSGSALMPSASMT